jgi:hypothetical protein
MKALYQQLELACKQGQAKQVEQLLPQWAALFFADESITYLGQLKGHTDALDKALLDLETCLYGHANKAPWHGDKILQAVSELTIPEKRLPLLGLKPLAD